MVSGGRVSATAVSVLTRDAPLCDSLARACVENGTIADVKRVLRWLAIDTMHDTTLEQALGDTSQCYVALYRAHAHDVDTLDELVAPGAEHVAVLRVSEPIKDDVDACVRDCRGCMCVVGALLLHSVTVHAAIATRAYAGYILVYPRIAA